MRRVPVRTPLLLLVPLLLAALSACSDSSVAPPKDGPAPLTVPTPIPEPPPQRLPGSGLTPMLAAASMNQHLDKAIALSRERFAMINAAMTAVWEEDESCLRSVPGSRNPSFSFLVCPDGARETWVGTEERGGEHYARYEGTGYLSDERERLEFSVYLRNESHSGVRVLWEETRQGYVDGAFQRSVASFNDPSSPSGISYTSLRDEARWHWQYGDLPETIALSMQSDGRTGFFRWSTALADPDKFHEETITWNEEGGTWARFDSAVDESPRIVQWQADSSEPEFP